VLRGGGVTDKEFKIGYLQHLQKQKECFSYLETGFDNLLKKELPNLCRALDIQREFSVA
jgi:hypothetical protein